MDADHPLQREELERLGLPVTIGVGEKERELMMLYPQPRGRMPAVEYCIEARPAHTVPLPQEGCAGWAPCAALIPKGSDSMVYGDGGVGKTTLMIDLAVHLAAGDDWLGIPVERTFRVLIVENEGPRPLF